MLLNRLRKAKDDNGFTLIELLVVVVIIGILVAIAIPLYLNYRKGAENKAAASDTRNAISAVEQYYTENGNQYPASQVGASGASLVFAAQAGGTTETANVSSGDVMTYVHAAGAASYTIATNSTDGGATYTYDSSTGKTVKS